MLAAWLTRLRSLHLAQFLSAYLVAGLLLTGLCLWLFWRISRAVLADGIVVAFDLALASELHLQATPFTTSLYRLVSWFGGTGLLIVGIIVNVFFKETGDSIVLRRGAENGCQQEKRQQQKRLFHDLII